LMGREREDGHIYFTGGLVAFPGFYLLSEKIGMSLYDTHIPVPQFNEKLLLSVERTLKRFSPSAPFERSSWEIVDDRNLHWHNIASLPPGGKVSVGAEDLFLRIDRQAFRKLPRSQAIIFAVHPLLKKLSDLADSPLIPALLSKIHEETSPDLIKYKAAPAYWDTVKPYLEQKTKEQIKKGLIGCDDLEKVTEFREFASRQSSR